MNIKKYQSLQNLSTSIDNTLILISPWRNDHFSWLFYTFVYKNNEALSFL